MTGPSPDPGAATEPTAAGRSPAGEATARLEAGHGPVVAGLVAAVVGFSSSFVVVLAGLVAVGASAAQAASGLLTLCVTQTLAMVWLGLRHRMPVSIAWSTPGAALLASSAGAVGGWPVAVGAFLVTGALILATAVVPRLGDLVASIPVPLAKAMLAGVLLPLCVAPVTAVVAEPAAVAPVLVVWLLLVRLAPRWAVPGALVAALTVVAVSADLGSVQWAPVVTWTTPAFSLSAAAGIALPLYVVTMASQNVPGVAVMAGYGYRVPWRETLAVTGVGTIAGAPSGGHAINLAAITAALTAGPAAGADRDRRWVATMSAAAAYVVLAAASSALAGMVAAAASGVMQAAAGLALLGTLAASLRDALHDEADREAAAATLVVAAAGITVAGIGSAFWALVAGLVVRAVVRRGRGPRRPRRLRRSPRDAGAAGDADGPR